MKLKELLEKRAKLLNELSAEGITEERFAQIKTSVENINFQIEEERRSIELSDKNPNGVAEEDLRAARLPNGTTASGVLFDQGNTITEQARAAQREQAEKRAATLRSGSVIKIEHRSTLTSSSTPLATVVSSTINPTFNLVGSLDKLAHEVHLEGAGAESYKKPFLKGIGKAEIGKEKTATTGGAEPTFGYAAINKVKIIAYAEVTEEVEKLPAADYIDAVESAVKTAWRVKLIDQMVNGSGSGELVGILNTPIDIVNTDQQVAIAAIDENTLDDFIYDYGGDENVESDTILILNKLTIKEFAKVKGSDKKKAYDIVIHGNTGTINSIPFVCTSNVKPFKTATGTEPYLIYGKMEGYELAYFSELEIEKSKDYKFKEGVTAYKTTGFVGGSTAMFNGFMTICKTKTSV